MEIVNIVLAWIFAAFAVSFFLYFWVIPYLKQKAAFLLIYWRLKKTAKKIENPHVRSLVEEAAGLSWETFKNVKF